MVVHLSTRLGVKRLLVPRAICIGVCATTALALGAFTSPVEAQQPPPTEFVRACNRLTAFHDKLEKKKNQFSSKKDAKALDGIAQQLQTMQTSDAASVAKALGDAKAGKARRRAIDKAFQFCDGQGSFQPTPLTVP